MAETSTQDVVKQAQSVGAASSTDVPGQNHTSLNAGVGDEESRRREGADKVPDAVQASADGKGSGGSGSPRPEHSDGAERGVTVNGITSDYAHVNGGDNASYTGSEDNLYQRSADGEASQGDSRGSAESNWRSRSDSFAKKTTAFKSVSVTKNFLAKTGTGPPNSIKAQLDKNAPGTQQPLATASVAKPRLVAKLGRDKLSHTLSGVPAVGGPDASKVWNRNKPAPAQPQKQFTDEELKQQFGIHMASRLQADEANKEGKWADIDDDEDDWAPENVQWMDGTKSTLLAEKAPTPVKAVQGQPPPKPEIEADQKPAILPPQPPASLQSAGKTILRPGARNAVQTRPGLALKAVPEAPSPAVKHTPTTSNKSPWAPIPIIDKASPIVFEPPPPSRPQMHARYDSSAIDDRPIASPAKEIAADDFDRSWRDNDRGSQTLFNSQSGRYEPVRGGRRSSRNDGGFRPQSLLQRPSQGQGSMEAFHSRDSQNQPWARRRESSSNDARPPMEQQDSAKGPTNPATAISPSMDEQKPSAPEEGKPAEPAIDPRLEQQRLMRERIELNRKRKQEEEAKEIAAKEERIRLRLAALAPPEEKAGVSASSDNTSLDNSTTTIVQPPPKATSDVQPSQSSKELESSSANSSLPPSSSLSSSQNQNQQRSQTKSPSIPVSISQPQLVSHTPSAPHSFAKPTSDSHVPSTQSSDLTELPGLGQPPPSHHQQPSHFNNYQENSWSTRSQSMATTVMSTSRRQAMLGNTASADEMGRSSNVHLPHTQVIAKPASASSSLMSPHPTPSPPQAGQAISNFVHPLARGRAQPTGGRRILNADQEQSRNQWQNFSMDTDKFDAATNEETKRIKLDLEAKKIDAQLAIQMATGAPMKAETTVKETYVATTSRGGTNGRRVVGKQQFEHEVPATSTESAFGQVSSGSVPQQSQQPLASITNGSKTSRFFPPGTIPSLTAIARPVDLHEPFCFDPHSPPPPEEDGHPAYERSNAQGSLTVRLPSAKPRPIVKLPPPTPATTIPKQQATVSMPVEQQPVTTTVNWQARFQTLLRGEQTTSQSASINEQATAMQPEQTSAPVTSYSKNALAGSPASTLATVSLPREAAKDVTRSVSRGSEPITKPGVESLMDEREFGSLPSVQIPKGVQQRDSRVLESHVGTGTAGQHDDLNRVESKKEFGTTVSDLLANPPDGMTLSMPGSTAAFVLYTQNSPGWIHFHNNLHKYNRKHKDYPKGPNASAREATAKVNGIQTANASKTRTKPAAFPKTNKTSGSDASQQKNTTSTAQASARPTQYNNSGFAKTGRGNSTRAHFGKPVSAQRQLA